MNYELTPEQEKRLEQVRDEAIQFAIGGDSNIDEVKFEKGVDFIYSLAEQPSPIKVIADSPWAAQIMANIVERYYNDKKPLDKETLLQEYANYDPETFGKKNYHSTILVGVSYDSGWINFYKAFKEFGILNDPEFDAYLEFVESGVWDAIGIGEFCIGIRRPTYVSLDDQQRLSNDQLPAISWIDGVEYHYLDGTAFEKEMWEKILSQTMTFDEILAISNADERAIVLKYNKNAIINDGAEMIDSSNFGELFRITGKRINDTLDASELYFIRMTCPTGRVFVEAVEPEFARANPTALACQAQGFGVPAEVYAQLRVEG